LAVVFKKQEISRPREPTNKHSGVIPGPSQREGRPLLHPTLSQAFGRVRGASAPVLGPKPWSPSTFQLWLCPCATV